MRSRLRTSSLLFFVLVALLALTVRLWGLFDLGMVQGDQAFYYEVAHQWAEGNPVLSWPPSPRRVFVRPAAYAGFASALKAVGETDFAIKLFNVAVDGILVCLLFWVARRTAGVLVAILVSLLYALSPFAIANARSELVHTSSSLFVLSSYACVVFAMVARSGWQRLVLWFSAGCAIALAGLTHEELFVLGLAIPICWFWSRSLSRLGSSREPSWWSLASSLAPIVAAVSWAVPRFPIKKLWLPRHNPEVVASLPPGFEASGFGSLIGVVVRGLANLFSATVSNGLLTAVVVVGLLWLFRLFRGTQRRKAVHTRVALLFVFVYFFATAWVLREFLTRWSLPLLSLSLLALMDISNRCTSGWPRVCRVALVTGIALAILTSSYAGYFDSASGSGQPSRNAGGKVLRLPQALEGLKALRNRTYSKRWSREVFDRLASRVHPDAKLLVAPSVHDPWAGRRLLQLPCYFGENAVFLLDRQESFTELLADSRVGWVLITEYSLRPSFATVSRLRHRRDGIWRTDDLTVGRNFEDFRNYRWPEEVMRIEAGLLAAGADLVEEFQFAGRNTRIWRLQVR